METHTVIIADRSLLAANMYQLLFASLGVAVITVQGLEEMREAIAALHGADLLVISANALSGHFERLASYIAEDRRFGGIAKIFLIGDRDRSRGWAEHLAVLSAGAVVAKPFHPDEFVSTVKRILAR